MAKKELSIKQTKALLEADIKTWKTNKEASKAIYFILGETGNGKTQLIQQVGEAMDMGMVEIGLGNALDPTEITGCRIPVLDEKTGDYTLKLALLDEIRAYIDSKKDYILFIDELGAEQPQMRNFLLKLFAERNLNGVILKNAYIVCAGNPPGNYKTTPLDPALRARVSIVWTEATSTEVSTFFNAKADKIRPDNEKIADSYTIVSNFIQANAKSFGGQDGDTQDMENPTRCARAYEFCVQAIYTNLYANDNKDMLKHTLVGILGDQTGAALTKFTKEGAVGQFTPDQIMGGNFHDPKDPAKWNDAMENLMVHIAGNKLRPAKDSYKHIIRFIEFGKSDQVNGFRRSIEQNPWGIPDTVQTKLETHMEVAGIGDDALLGESDTGTLVDDAKKASSAPTT